MTIIASKAQINTYLYMDAIAREAQINTYLYIWMTTSNRHAVSSYLSQTQFEFLVAHDLTQVFGVTMS